MNAWAGDQDCVPLTRVDVGESEIFSPAAQRRLLAPFFGRCVDADLLRELLNAVSAYYLDLGFVTTRPYLREQNILDGQVEIEVLVGTVESIVDADSNARNSRISSAFAFHGEVLSLRELETSLEMIERVPSVSARIEIRPGTAQGGSIVAIKSTEAERFRLELGINAETDLDSQLSLRAAYDNPLNINDIIEFRYNHGDVRESFQSNRSRELNYSFPLGSFLWALAYRDIEFEQRVQGINESLLSEGESQTAKLSLSKLIARAQVHKVRLGLALELKDSKSFFENQLIDVSSYKTSQVQLELQHTWLRSWGQVFTRYAYYEGLDSFGARDDDYFTLEDGSENEARLQFEKFIIDSSLYYQHKPGWFSNARLVLHYSDDILFINDQLSLGSPYTVRGYKTALSGSNAWYLRYDLVRQLRAVNRLDGDESLAKSLSLGFGIDYGEVRCEVDNSDTCGEIYGLGVNLDIVDKNFSGHLHWGHPLKQIGDDIGDEDRFLLDLRWMI